MNFKESDRLRTRLFALEFRLAEVDHEARQSQLEVNQLESRLENARLAQMMGEDAGDPAQIRPELERSRGQLATQQELIASIKASRRQARAALAIERLKERRAERLAAEGQPG